MIAGIGAVGLLILFSVFAMFVCGSKGAVGAALFFGFVALVLFINTPTGAPLPGKVLGALEAVSNSSEPVLGGRPVEALRDGGGFR